MNHTNSYTINSSLFQEFLGLLGNMAHSDLIRQIEYIKVENEILRSKLPKRITTTPAEKKAPYQIWLTFKRPGQTYYNDSRVFDLQAMGGQGHND